jgi:threonine/homoserine/homoserine lactone efflux protein
VGSAIGQLLAMAVGVGLSPIPIVAVVLMLVSARARVNGPAFLAGWVASLVAIGVVVLVVLSPSEVTSGGEPATWSGWAKIGLGVLLVGVAVRQWRARPGPDDAPAMPKWMGAIDNVSPPKALGAGALLAGVNPKNLILALSAALAIAQAGVSGGQQAVAYAVFVVIGSIGVGVPVVLFFALGDRSRDMLERLKAWMGRHNHAIMSVICLVIAAKLVGDGVSALTA